MERYVDIESVKRMLKEEHLICEGMNTDYFLSLIETADVQPVVHAHLVKYYGVCEFDFSRYETYRCSNCKGEVDDDVDYCSHCGAKMDEVIE